MKAQRWQRRKEERAPEILSAALSCFAEKGFAATRMEDVAAKAGITKGTVYLYFESKEALFKALARSEIGARLAEITERITSFEGSSADMLRMVLSTMGTVVRTSDAIVLPKVMLAEAGQFPELAEFWRREIVDRGLALFETILRRGMARGEFRALPPQHVARMCVAPVLLVALWRTIFSRFDTEPYDYQALIDIHIDTLLRGLKADAAGIAAKEAP